MIATARALDTGRRTILFLLLCAVAAVAFRPAWAILPTDGDNLYVLAWVDQADLSSLLALDEAIYPEWRPLAYLTVWIGHHLMDGPAAGTHLAVNLFLWVACAWVVLLMVHALTGSLASAAAAALLLVIDQRSVSTLTWIVERQMSLACLCGLTAMLLMMRTAAASVRRQAVVALLLLASGLAKEYGLAFAMAVGAYGVLQARRDYAWPAAAALAAYCALRIGLAGGALAVYCEDMGFGFASAHTCINPIETASWPQMLYNSTATLVSSIMPGFFGGDGALQWRPVRFSLAVPMLLLAAVGAAARPRAGLLAILLAIATAVLSAYLFRSRNQLAVACAVAMAAGCGLAHLSTLLAGFGSTRLLRAAMVFALGLSALLQALTSRDRIADEVQTMLVADPCESFLRQRPFVDSFISDLKAHLALPDAECEAPER